MSSSAAKAEIAPTDPSQSAKAASLVYASDAEPGIARRRTGKGFRYVDADGGNVTDERTLARIRSLAIPPAWSDVWIARSPRAHIQATGRDARGRKQYRYHARWAECRDEVKYSSLVEFAGQLPVIRQKVDADLSLRGLPRDKVLASVVWLLDNLMIRVGNAGYAAENGSFGLTTLRDRHVRIAGDTLRFAFKGKSGKEWKLKISDRRIARIVKGAQDVPGQHLFQYFDEQGQRRHVASHDVNDYLRTDGDFTSKHFRTWGGTVEAATELVRTPLPSSAQAAARELNAAIDRVAAKLGNTRSVCRKCYVHPLVIDSWQAGELEWQMAEIARHVRQRKWMAREEANVLEWLTVYETA